MNQRIPSLDQFIFEQVSESVNPSSSLAIIKKGDIVWRVMERLNPQIGTYYVFDKKTVVKTTPKSIVCDDESTYSRIDGKRKNKSEAAYGSAYYSIMTEEEAIKEYSRLQSDGYKVRGM